MPGRLCWRVIYLGFTELTFLHPMTNTSSQEGGTSLAITVHQDWVNAYLARKAISIPVADKYTLINLSCRFSTNELILLGEIQEKPGSNIEAISQLEWNIADQRFRINKLDIKTKSKNLLIKSAGWLAGTFMQDKVDARIEEMVNALFQAQLEELKLMPVNIPIPKHGNATINVEAIHIESMTIREKEIQLDVVIQGAWKLSLDK